MRKLNAVKILLLTFILSSQLLKAQDNLNSTLSSNQRSENETVINNYDPENFKTISDNEIRIKNAVEENAVTTLGSSNHNETELIKGNAPFFETASNQDWVNGLPQVATGEVNGVSSLYHKQIDMKMGEDGNVYLAVSRAPNGNNWHARIEVYRSANNGVNWIYLGSINYVHKYISSLSMLVESRDNFVGDSTRIIVFYTMSDNTFFTNSSLYFSSFKRNSAGLVSGMIASPSSNFTFHSVSAVSDGAFYANGTYLGAVVSEIDPLGSNLSRLRVYRSANWGQSWSTATLITSNFDFYPSAQFSRGSTDEIWIAVERRLSPTERQIRVIRTPWSPSPAYSTDMITSGVYLYEKPCLSIKQNNPVDSALITCTRNSTAVYHSTTDAGNSWLINSALDLSNKSNTRFTWCSSAPSGESPFTALYVSNDGDSISVRRGVLRAMGTTRHQANSVNSSINVSPVCAARMSNLSNFAMIGYAGESNNNTFFWTGRSEVYLSEVDHSGTLHTFS